MLGTAGSEKMGGLSLATSVSAAGQLPNIKTRMLDARKVIILKFVWVFLAGMRYLSAGMQYLSADLEIL